MKRAWLLLAFAACPGPGATPRPFGLERSSVSLVPGQTAYVGFRVHRTADQKTLAAPPAQLDGKLDTAIESFVIEDDAFAGAITLTATLETRPGDYSVVIGSPPETIRVTVSSEYSGAVEPGAEVIIDAARSRRSTIAKEAPGYTAVLAADGTVWETSGTDGGVRRVERLSGVRAITSNGPQGFRAVTLEDAALDVRHGYSVRGDGTVQGSATTNVAAVRPFEFTAPPPSSQRMDVPAFLSTNGTVSHPSGDTAVIRGAVDVTALGALFRRKDDVLFERDGAGVYRPLFSSPGLTAFEGDQYVFFEGSTQRFARHWLALTREGLVVGGTGPLDLRLVQPPAGVEVTDVMARDRWWFALDGQRRLFMGAAGGTLTRTAFPPVRVAAPSPDIGVFSAPIPVTPGQTVQVPLRVARAGVTGPVTLSAMTLPAGVSAPAVVVPENATSATLALTFAPTARVAPSELEFSLRGDGVERTTLLSAELPRRARRLSVAKDVVRLADGTVWRFGAGAPAQLPGLANVVAITDNLALDASGAVYSFGSNSVGQLGRPGAATVDHPPALVPGVPAAMAVAHCTTGMNLSLVLDRTGRVWRFGAVSTTSPGNETPTLVDQLPAMVDIGGEGSPAGLDADGNVWLLLKAKKFDTPPVSRLGLVFDGAPATIDQNYSVPGHGALSSGVKALWFTGWATLVDGTVWSLNLGAGLTKQAQLMGAEPAAYATQEGVVVKTDGTLWRRATSTAPLTRVAGLGAVALPE